MSVRGKYSGQEDQFLQYIYEKVVSMTKTALDAGDEALLTSIITTLGAVGSATALEPGHGLNINASLAILHISETGVSAFWDAAAEALRSIRDVGVSSIRTAKDDGSASKKILGLGKLSIVARKWFVVNVI